MYVSVRSFVFFYLVGLYKFLAVSKEDEGSV
jgi:hypothetical protein